ncbi:riboflavin kinase [Westerdykella ornata]|uniref:Riboflavin kinase n=1 Tax=Westerdykella ornata TaxID=318751 RepID=A0A6A6JS34_WESOR|nr:riboflavin kinase [Westerdykella ornata]KAF2279074.1 riboflavin kinase [Westerdykella ornata]
MPLRPSHPRDPIAGPPTPSSPYPLRLRGPVIKGFGRGSKELGIPTANIPIEGLSINGYTNLESGIYYGWASLDYSTIEKEEEKKSSNHAVADLESSTASPEDDELIFKTESGTVVYPTVLSIGYNPYYSNQHRSIELHLLARFPRDFYGATLSLLILGYIRPEYDYVSMEALVDDIREDIRVARRSLNREAYLRYRGEDWLEGKGGDGEAHKRSLQGVGQKDAVGISQMDP